MARLSMSLLGGFQVSCEGIPINGFRSNKVRALLAYAAVEAHPHLRDHLAALLWPEVLDAVARTYLRQALADLRRVLDRPGQPPALETDRYSVWLNPAVGLSLDVASLAEALHTSASLRSSGADEVAVTTLEQALALYRGDFMQGFCLLGCEDFQEWQARTAEHLRRQAAESFGPLSQWHAQAGNLERASACALRQVELEPWLEEGHRQLMRLLADAGEPVAAVAHYQRYRSQLAVELHTEPTAETQALHAAIQADSRTRDHTPVETGNLPATHGGKKAPFTDLPRSKLETPLTPLVGRVTERAEISAMLHRPEVRLTTLTGPGGVGKTRLAQQLAQDLLAAFPDGVYFISLLQARVPQSVPSVVAQTLGLREDSRQPVLATLQAALRHRRLLLVLDNFEHVLSAAPMVSELLRACTGMKALVTSREVLRLSGEYEYVVDPLALPPEDLLAPLELCSYAAVELFRQRAEAVHHGFVLDWNNALLAAQICRRLDGLPLAIELAAAHLRHLPLSVLWRHFANPTSSSLQLLNRGASDAPERHRSLAATIAWSYDLLDRHEQALFRRLAVFPGSWTTQAAATVCTDGNEQDVLPGLLALADKSLLRPVGQSSDLATTRFSMLETLREFGREQLRAANELGLYEQRMARYYLALAEDIMPRMYGPQYAVHQQTLLAEHPNLQAALEYALATGDADLAMRLCASLIHFWNSFPREAARATLQTLELLDGPPDKIPQSITTARFLVCAGYYAYLVHNQGLSYQLMSRSAAMLGDPQIPFQSGIGNIPLGILALIMLDRGQFDQCDDYHRQALAKAERAGDRWATAMVLTNIGNVERMRGNLTAALPLIERALAIHHRIGQAWGISKTRLDLAELHLQLGELGLARCELEDCLTDACEYHMLDAIASVTSDLGLLALAEGEYGQARTLFRQALQQEQALGRKSRYLLDALLGLASEALLSGHPAAAMRLAAVTSGLISRSGLVSPAVRQTRLRELERSARSQLDPTIADAAWAEGFAVPTEQAIEYALGLL